MSIYDSGNNPVKSYPASNYKRLGLDVYPHPYFDASSWYIPPTVKEMYRWCLFLYQTNSTIGPVIRKKASYVVTDLVYSSTDPKTKEGYKRILEKVLRIKELEFKMLLDFEVYGNAFVSLLFPFDRYLKCPHCNYENMIKTIKWEYDGDRFLGKCKNCQAKTRMEPIDKYVKIRERMNIIRWNPQYIEPQKNIISGRTNYILRIPRWLKQRIKDPKINQVYVEDTPKAYLDAIRENKNIKLDPDNVFHMKFETISMEDDSLGIPPILNVIKDAWLLQTYRKGQEQIALDHMLPLTLISPMPAPAGASPHGDTDLGSWRAKMQNIISQWRRDQNALFPVPFPVQVSQVRGDAAALNVHNDIAAVRQQIAGGLDVPPEFLYGQLNWTGGNVTLRVLENLLLNRLASLNSFLEDWLVPKIRSYFGLGPCDVSHQDFKMADDIQQKQIAMNLRATNTVSDKTVLEELGFDKVKEDKQKKDELQSRLREMEQSQIAQAEIQAKVTIINARAQAEAQAIMAKAQQEQMAAQQQMMPQGPMPPQPGEPGMPAQENAQEAPPEEQQAPNSPYGRPPGNNGGSMAGSMPQVPSPLVLDLMANHFLKSTPPEQQDYQISVMRHGNPMLADAIKERIRTIQRATQDIQPLPEQKPPQRGPDKAVI